MEAVKKLVAAGEVRMSEHGYDEIASDGIYVRDILAGVDKAAVVEDYPTSLKVALYWCYNLTEMPGRFMLYGEYRKDLFLRR